MAYEETPQEKQQRQAKEADWAAKGKAAEKAQDDAMLKPVRDAGAAAVKGMEEGRMDAMGNAYKKGGFVEHSQHVKKHAAGFKHHDDHVKTMCSGGKSRAK
jgi:hypothetical protein